MSGVPDESWAEVARAAAQALGLLGYPVPACLPGDPEACGGGFAEHAMAGLVALQEVAGHQLLHLRPPADQVLDVRGHVQSTLDHHAGCAGCQP